MKVRTLIANLQHFPLDAEVRITIAKISDLHIEHIAVEFNSKGIPDIELVMKQ
jgi:hypothetical protein